MTQRQPALFQNGDIRIRLCRYGSMLYSIKDTYIGRSLEIYGEYCGMEAQLYRQILKPGQTVIDAGANIGCHTVLFGQAVDPKGSVWTFEPQRVIFQMLCANIAANNL